LAGSLFYAEARDLFATPANRRPLDEERNGTRVAGGCSASDNSVAIDRNEMLIVGEAVTRRGPVRRTVLVPFGIASSILSAARRSNGERVCIDLAMTCRA
jgi:hypothetical protein